MKNKFSALITFGIILMLSLFTLQSCTTGPPTPTPIATEQATTDSLEKVAQSTPNRYIIVKDGQSVTASVITYTTTTTKGSDGKENTVQALHYICPCGAKGTVLPPYTVDTIKQAL